MTQNGNNFFERHDKPTPNGGAYSIAFFYDKDRQPCSKQQAVFINIVEYAQDGSRINEVYGHVSSKFMKSL
jgi:hypothetical protein